MINSLGYHNSKRNEKKIDKLKYKVIVFVLYELTKVGIQKNEISFPFDGRITEINASCRLAGTDVGTVMSVEKISSTDFKADGIWTKIADSVVIPVNEKTNSNVPVNISDRNINEDDYIRIVIDSAGNEMRNIVVEVIVELDLS
jgi:hypothetical protein